MYQPSLTCMSPLLPWTRGQALGVRLQMMSEMLAETPASAYLGAHGTEVFGARETRQV